MAQHAQQQMPDASEQCWLAKFNKGDVNIRFRRERWISISGFNPFGSDIIHPTGKLLGCIRSLLLSGMTDVEAAEPQPSWPQNVAGHTCGR